jgi:membrane carboxypeptidase/penicillin-binding protein
MDLPAAMDAFAKTGTGMKSDASFVLLLPRIVMLAWSGMDDNEELPMEEGFQGATAAEPIVTKVVLNMWRRRPDLFPVERVIVPRGIVRRPVNRIAGCIALGNDFEYFLEDVLPPSCSEKQGSLPKRALLNPQKTKRRASVVKSPNKRLRGRTISLAGK